MFVGLLLAGAATLVTPADRQSPRLDTAPVSRNLTAGQMFALADAATARGNIALAETTLSSNAGGLFQRRPP